MPDVHFSDYVTGLGNATLPLNGTENIVIIQGGVDKHCLPSDIIAGGGGLITSKLSFSSADILAGFTTQKTFVASPGAGKIIRPIGLVTKYTYGTTTYTGGGNLIVHLQGQIVFSNAIHKLTATTYDFANLTAFNSGTEFNNAGLYAKIETSNPTGGNGTLDLYVAYTIITL